MEKSEIFLEKYKDLEAAITLAYGDKFEGSAVSWLERQKEFRDVSSGIKCCREVRNLLQHNVKMNGKSAVTPDSELISFVEKLTDRIQNPELCIKYAVPIRDVFYRRPTDNVYDTMRYMKKLGYTHVPVLSGGKVVGVFSEHTAFEFFLRNYEDNISKNTTFADISEFISLDRGERFVFCPTSSRLSRIIDIFEEGINSNRKVKMAFLTATGSRNEKLEAIISHWDIIGLQ